MNWRQVKDVIGRLGACLLPSQHNVCFRVDRSVAQERRWRFWLIALAQTMVGMGRRTCGSGAKSSPAPGVDGVRDSAEPELGAHDQRLPAFNVGVAVGPTRVTVPSGLDSMRVMGMLTGCRNDEVRIGMEVESRAPPRAPVTGGFEPTA